MKSFLILLLIALVAVASAKFTFNSKLKSVVHHKLNQKTSSNNVRAARLTERFITQSVDHFSEDDSRTFLQRFWFNEDFYQPGGPIFIYVNGFDGLLSAAEDQIVLERYLPFEMAAQYNGIMYLFENRFFGQSRPTSDMSMSNLQYLTIEQSLEDFAEIIRTIRGDLEEFGSDIVLMVGRQTGSSLATWLRQKYPELVFGVWSSSAPLEARVEFPEFFEDISNTYNNRNPECHGVIERGFQQLEDLFAAGNTAEIQNIFGLNYTPDADSPTAIGLLNGFLGEMIAIWPEYFDMDWVDDICDFFTETHEVMDEINTLAAFVAQFVGIEAMDITYEDTVALYRNTSWESEAGIFGGRAAFYFQCTQMSLFQTDNGNSYLSGNRLTVDLFTQACRDIFDDSLQDSVIAANNDRTNNEYNGVNPSVTQTYFTNGQLDPYRLVSVTEQLNIDTPAIVFDNYGKSHDFYIIDLENDSPQLIAFKQMMLDSIAGLFPLTKK